MTDFNRAPDPFQIVQHLPEGACVILRDYDHSERGALALGLKSICGARGLKFLVGADIRLAELVGADGIHLPGWALRKAIDRPESAGLVTAACHNASDLIEAAGLGADAAFVSPIFETGSHPGRRALGATTFRALAASARLPVLALGGVDERNCGETTGRNVCGFGAIGAFLPCARSAG